MTFAIDYERAIDSLPVKFQEILAEMINGKKVNEITQKFKMSRSTVNRCIKKIRMTLKKRDIFKS